MHLRTLARRLGSVALAASLALGAAACSGGTDGASPVEGRESASEDAGTEESSEDSTTEETTEPEVEEESTEEEASDEAPAELSAADFYPSVMGALKDAETFAFESSTGVGGEAMNVSGEARYDDSGMAMKATATGAQPMEMIMLDQVIYMKSAQVGGDKWLKIDLKASESSLYGMLAKATDPEAMFKAMETPKKLEVVGTEEVDGVATNHYRITMDAKDYMKAMGFPAEMSSFLPDELVTDMWVDAENLPRKFSQSVETPTPGGGKPVTTTTEGLYSDFGIDVEIEAPPASETTDAPALPGA